MLYQSTVLTLLLICMNMSFCQHLPQDSTGLKENYNVLPQISGEQSHKLKTGFIKRETNIDPAEIHDRNNYEDLYGAVFKPDWQVKSSRTESYSYNGFLRNEDSNLNSESDLDKPNNIQIGSFDFKITQKQETCFHSIQNEIANLFYDDVDISKKIFPLCCKTEARCKPKTTMCMSISKTVPKTTRKRQEPQPTPSTFKQLTTTSVHHRVSNEAVVNVVIHVKCDHPEAREHDVPKPISLYPPSNCAVSNNISQFDIKEPKYNFSVNILNSKITEVTKFSILKTTESLNEIKINGEPCVKIYEHERHNGNPDEKSFEDPDSNKEDTCKDDSKIRLPKPLLPHDITVQVTTKPTHKPQATAFPVFICQLTPRFCTFNVTKPVVLARSVKPGFTLWKNINLAVPHFWHSIPTTTTNECSQTESKVEELNCDYEKTVKQTTEEHSSDRRVLCSPDPTPDSVACEPSFNNSEESENSTEKNGINECVFKFGIPTQIEGDSTKPVLPILESTQKLSNKELDQTLPELCYSDTESLQTATEQAQSSIELPVTEPHVGSGQSLMDQLLTEDVSPAIGLGQTNDGIKKTPSSLDELNLGPGREIAGNVLKPNSQEKIPSEGSELSTPKYGSLMTTSNMQSLLKSVHLSTGVSGAITEPGSLLALKTAYILTTQGSLDNLVGPPVIYSGLPLMHDDDERTQTSPVNTLDILKSTSFLDSSVHPVLDESSEKYISTGSIEKLTESENSVQDLSIVASEAVVGTLKLPKERNDETTVSSPTSFITTNNSNTNIIIPITPEIHSFEMSGQTESAFSTYPLTDYLSTIKAHNNDIIEGDINHIIELNNNNLIFYYNHKWFMSNKNRVWNFDEGTVEVVNDTFCKLSVEHLTDNNEKNKEIIQNILNQKGAYNESEDVPFEIFAQAILYYRQNNNDSISTFEWSGMTFNLKELIAMLRIINFESFNDIEWETVNWMNIYKLVKESAKTTTQDYIEYNIHEADGSTHSLVVFSNGSSTWKDTKLERSELYHTIQNVNSKTDFSKRIIMNEPYRANDQSFLSFAKHVFQQRLDLNVMYSEYIWESNSYSWEELLAILVMIHDTLTYITNQEISIRQDWDNLLAKFRNSRRHYYIDKTVYDIRFDPESKSMTIFTNGTTDFDGKRVTLDDIAQKVKNLPLSEVSTSGVKHVINLGGGKFQFYWDRKWYITDYIRTWSFEDQTSSLMNASFFSLPEDTNVSQDSIQRLLEESSYNNKFEMPFELFAQSMLTTAKYPENKYYQWSGYTLSYADLVAMLRISDFNNFNVQAPDLKWGQINWHAIYDRVILSPKSTSYNLQAYEMLDYDGTLYPLVVFSNGTSIWKHSKLDLTESLTMLQSLNSKSQFPDIISVSSYISSADSFIAFLTGAISDRIHNKILHSHYIWKNYQFQWEDLEAINRMLLHHYESKLANELSFSNIALPILSSSKQVFPNRTEFQVSLGSENKPLVVYSNGTTEYDNIRLEFMDTVQRVDELKKNSNLAFKEDWGSEVNTLKEVKINNTEPLDNNSNKGGFHGYDWKQFNNNPYYNVCYPINLGGGKVQFYMKNIWYITDGETIWPFEDPLTSFYINELVKAMNTTFPDDSYLDKTSIQHLVDSKQTLKGLEELVMPHELILQHYLFFMSQLDPKVAFNLSQDLIYQREKLHMNSIQLLIALRLSAFNNFTTKEVELPWEKGKKPNWDWFFIMSKRSEQIEAKGEWADSLNTSYFDEFKDSPLLLVYSNLSSDWGGQRLELGEALVKVQKANERNRFLPVEVNGELTSENKSFESLYKDALNKRFENNKTYSKYKWLSESVSWFDILLVVRCPEAKPSAIHDNMFWKNSIKEITKAWKSKYSDKIEYEINEIGSKKDVKATIYMNESTILNGKKMDIDEYRALLK